MNEQNDEASDALQDLGGEAVGEAPSAEQLAQEIAEDVEQVEAERDPEMPVHAAYRKAPIRSSNPVSVKGRKRLINAIFGLGFLLMIPGIWATAILMGVNVPGSHKDNADGMAKMMLISWPLAILLFIFAGWLFKDLKRMQAAAKRARQ